MNELSLMERRITLPTQNLDLTWMDAKKNVGDPRIWRRLPGFGGPTGTRAFYGWNYERILMLSVAMHHFHLKTNHPRKQVELL